MLSISLVTLGDPGQRTGGYLFHDRMVHSASQHDARIAVFSFPRWPFPSASVLGGRLLARATARTDVVLVDSIVAALVTPWLASRPRHPPLTAICHQPPGGSDHAPLRARLQVSLDLRAYRRMARIVTTSDRLATTLVAAGVAPDRIRVVTPGRDLEPARSAVVAQDLRAGRQVALLCVANWLPRKGILELLDAVARLPPEATFLHLAGSDSVDRRYGALVHRRLGEPDLAGRVVCHGSVSPSRIAELCRDADIFVLPSTNEPYGMAYGEAMAAGLPVVGWDSGNLPSLAVDGQEGLLVPPGDIAALATALRRLTVDAPLRLRLGRAARLRAQSLPTWDECARAFFAALREVADV
jgi:glycosyltransferase involved in cell wall biosynthesis